MIVDGPGPFEGAFQIGGDHGVQGLVRLFVSRQGQLQEVHRADPAAGQNRQLAAGVEGEQIAVHQSFSPSTSCMS